ncbi:hypothetical protein [Marinicellulosiphila megalodicopiae]|uniref:hypothetical protein n=1 Tax=Marinicellulosiphila megalodicopiae TaxID=2724896 RepID=UPI003BB0DE84
MSLKLLQSRDILKLLISAYQNPIAVLDMKGNFWMHNINMHKEIETSQNLTFQDNKIQILDKNKKIDKLKNIELNFFLKNINTNTEEMGRIKINDGKYLDIKVVTINQFCINEFDVILLTLLDEYKYPVKVERVFSIKTDLQNTVHN